MIKPESFHGIGWAWEYHFTRSGGTVKNLPAIAMTAWEVEQRWLRLIFVRNCAVKSLETILSLNRNSIYAGSAHLVSEKAQIFPLWSISDSTISKEMIWVHCSSSRQYSVWLPAYQKRWGCSGNRVHNFIGRFQSNAPQGKLTVACNYNLELNEGAAWETQVGSSALTWAHLTGLVWWSRNSYSKGQYENWHFAGFLSQQAWAWNPSKSKNLIWNSSFFDLLFEVALSRQSSQAGRTLNLFQSHE